MSPLLAAVLGSAVLAAAAPAQEEGAGGDPGGLTAIAGIEVGHHTLDERPTGCTVILTVGGAVAGVDVRGGAPGTRETALLDPVNTVQEIHAVVLSGGSAFGLDAASGVMKYLEEKGVGFPVGSVRVPIVTSAILFDLFTGGKPEIRPGADCGYRAASLASRDLVAEGSVGAGAGATVGKLAGRAAMMRGGLGTASITLDDGLTVGALVAVNAVGDVIDPGTGRVVAGARSADGSGLADARLLIRSGSLHRPPAGTSTTIGVVATNARLTQAQATKVAQMAQDGLARAISPAHTPMDGDTIFALATGVHDEAADVLTIGALAAELMSEAIVRAVRAAQSLPGLPAASTLP